MIRPRLLALACAAALASPAFAAEPPPSASLPVVEVPAAHKGDTLMVFYSGDGGWADLDSTVSKGLAQRGLPVLGVDSLRYFITRHTPEGAAQDLTDALDRYSRTWGAKSIALAGYSFGADALPLIIPSLPSRLQERIKLVVLVSPDTAGRLVFRPTDWLNLPLKSDVPLTPALERMKGMKTLCFYGADDRDSGCPGFGPLVERALLPGGHHFSGHGYDRIVDAIMAALGGAPSTTVAGAPSAG